MTEQMLDLTPITLKEARRFVDQHHRHHRAPTGGLFAIGAACDLMVVGVVIVGRPVARLLSTGYTAEVSRVCVLEGYPNACSMLYAAAWRAARAMGYRRLVTYVLASESGTSLRAAGWKEVGSSKGGSWSRTSRPRVDLHPTGQKTLWQVGPSPTHPASPTRTRQWRAESAMGSGTGVANGECMQTGQTLVSDAPRDDHRPW